MQNPYYDVKFRDIFKKIDPDRLRNPINITVPNEFYQYLLDNTLERGYLDELSERTFENFGDYRKITWIKIERLPIHPDDLKEYDLISRWQGVLSSLHTWDQRLYFLLQRENGVTNLYLGTVTLDQGTTAEEARVQFKEAVLGSMPGIDLNNVDNPQSLNLDSYNAIGTVTGIPSFKQAGKTGFIQTLDQLAFGIRDENDSECNYAVMIIADPLNDQVISQTISKFRKLGSEIHTGVSQTINDGETQGVGHAKGSGIGVLVGAISAIGLSCLGLPPYFGSMLGALFSASINTNFTTNTASTKEYLDKFAKYAENITDSHCNRLQKGRNLGFWNVGIYVLGTKNTHVNTVMGILRSIYSGDESYVEPIRTHILRGDSNALDIVISGNLIPLIKPGTISNEKRDLWINERSHRYINAPINSTNLTRIDDEWNIFGKAYEYVSTPMNTEELSIATSLPRRDVPGLRFVKSAVRFANNSSLVSENDSIILGKIIDMGVEQNNVYKINVNALVRHALVAGSTGSGKSTTCKTIIHEVLERDIPVLIIEPAKDDYVRWAIEQNKKIMHDPMLSKDEKNNKRFRVYMPGVNEFCGERIQSLKLNPFQPAGIEGAPIDMVTRCEQVISLFNASLPVSDILPVLLDETFYQYVYDSIGNEGLSGEVQPLDSYPILDDSESLGQINISQKAREILSKRGYDQKVQHDLGAALETRFKYLTRGKRGDILNVDKSTDFTELFKYPTVINLSKIANQKDKALIMSLLLLSIYEYRVSAYTYNDAYRRKAQENKLLHLTVVEEAHNVLMNPGVDIGHTGSPQQAVADLFSNILSEIRGYGQGFMIVDQIPTRLIPDTIKNTNYKIVHRLTALDDCAVMATSLALRNDQQKIISSLSVGDAIICGDLDDAAAWVKIKNP